MAAISKELREASQQPWFQIMMKELGYEPIKHGKWIDRTEDEDGIYEFCSVCQVDADITHYGKSFAYCPNCGAKMDE